MPCEATAWKLSPYRAKLKYPFRCKTLTSPASRCPHVQVPDEQVHSIRKGILSMACVPPRTLDKLGNRYFYKSCVHLDKLSFSSSGQLRSQISLSFSSALGVCIPEIFDHLIVHININGHGSGIAMTFQTYSFQTAANPLRWALR